MAPISTNSPTFNLLKYLDIIEMSRQLTVIMSILSLCCDGFFSPISALLSFQPKKKTRRRKNMYDVSVDERMLHFHEIVMGYFDVVSVYVYF